jgi:hypothetical protein
MRIDEIFDKPSHFDVSYYSDFEFAANFEINGKQYRFKADRDSKRDPFDIRFAQGWGGKSEEILGTGDSIEVFSTVVAIINHLVTAKGDWPSFTFLAVNQEPSRVKLYKRIAKAMLSKYGEHYRGQLTHPYGTATRWTFLNKDTPEPSELSKSIFGVKDSFD